MDNNKFVLTFTEEELIMVLSGLRQLHRSLANDDRSRMSQVKTVVDLHENIRQPFQAAIEERQRQAAQSGEIASNNNA